MTAARALQAAASGVLVLLVALGVALSTRLWLFNPYLSPPPTNPSGYVAADAVRGLQAADLTTPLRFVLHFGPRRTVALGDPGDSRFGALWALVRPLLRRLTPAEMRAARPVGPAAAAAQEQAPGASLGLDFAVEMGWNRWWSLLSGGPWPGGADPNVGRIWIVPGPGATEVDLMGSAGGVAVRLPAAAGRALAGELASLEPQPMGYGVVPLTGAPSGLTVEPGIDVPAAGLRWPPLAVQPEALDVAALAATLFPQGSVVRQALQDNGSRFFTDGTDWLRVAPRGGVQYDIPGGRQQPVDAPWSADLQAAVRFVGRHGGWPPTAVLVGTSNRLAPGSFSLAAGAGTRTGRTFSFAVRVRGLPVFSDPPAVEVETGAVGIQQYWRNVPAPTARLPSGPYVTPSTALAELAHSWPSSLASSPRVVTSVFPAYRLAAGASRLEPVWAIALQGGAVVLVDAPTGRVLGPATTTAAGA